MTRIATGLLLIGGLVACQDSGYPSLRSVPDASRPSLSIEDRREIVRGLLDERDLNREQTALVRGRSGLEAGPAVDPADDPALAEQIIPDDAGGGNQPFQLRSDDKVPADSVYRDDAQFDDGSLDDFIRRLKRETRPPAPDGTEPADIEPIPDEPEIDDPDDADVSALWQHPPAHVAWAPSERLRHLAAFAPGGHRTPLGDDREIMIRLAAAEDEPGFFCGYLGWTVAWSSMCIDDAETPVDDSEQGVGADLEQELRPAPDEAEPGQAPESPSSSGSAARRERAERRLSEEDAAEAIEDAGRTVIAPVADSLEKLRDFLDARRSRDAAQSPAETLPSLRTVDPPEGAAAIDRPPIPRDRPERREDITVVDRGERFDFVRTPRPAFKPSPDLPVILPPLRATEPAPKPRLDPPPRPLARPSDLPLDRDDGDAAPLTSDAEQSIEALPEALALATDLDAATMPPEAPRVPAGVQEAPVPPVVAKAEPAPLERPASSALVTPPAEPEPAPAVAALDRPDERLPVVVAFEPERPGLPEGAATVLAALLAEARARGETIHIIGEASTNHLARRRATDVGAALVQLGATVEILEYDHEAIAGLDQVRLVISPDNSLETAPAAQPSTIER